MADGQSRRRMSPERNVFLRRNDPVLLGTPAPKKIGLIHIEHVARNSISNCYLIPFFFFNFTESLKNYIINT